ncbi:cysteine-rich CWC family protein [Bradyrhizobium sp. cf659]|uniref:cysteine-rich CWC family protein n=1 Tax=Bradyrhizobium sp. cf659 TaxID=1761771 RepID=UPI000B8422CC|nr:cysteine-rich CWC family protein [Bradyrhizobium sp. cf659]
MTIPKESSMQEPRRLACSRCGTEFGCDLSGTCWCAEETARLPMPVKGEDCLCRECLRKAAAAGAAE